MNLRVWITLLVLGALSPVSFGQDREQQTSQLKSEFKELMRQNGIPGISFAIVENQSVLIQGGMGWANIEKKKVADENTLYPTASLAKPISAVMVVQLVEQGKLSLNTPMSDFRLPSLFPGRDHATIYKKNRAQVQHVMSHTSHGIPGTSFRYDGDRFVDITWVIEQSCGESFQSRMNNEIIAKAKMSDSIAGLLSHDALLRTQRLAIPYENDPTGQPVRSRIPVFGDAKLRSLAEQLPVEAKFTQLSPRVKEFRKEWLGDSFEPLPSLNSSAGFITSVRDLARFDIRLDRGEWINADSRQKMFTPFETQDKKPSRYGLGWFLEDLSGKQVVWHYGWMPPSVSALYIKIPEDNLTLILLSNSEYLSSKCNWSKKGICASPFARSFFKIFLPSN